MTTFFIVIFLILFFIILFANCYTVVEEYSTKNVGGGMLLFWPFIVFGIYCLTDPIAERPIFFGVTTMLTLLSALALMAYFFFRGNKTTILLNAIFYFFLFSTLIYRYNNQSVAVINRCETIITADNETLFKLSDSTRFCDWNKDNSLVFTVIKTEKIMSPSDKCIYCGKSVAKHEDKQYTEEEYKKSRNAKMQ